MEEKNIEIRSFGGIAQPVVSAEGRTIEGYAIVFNTPSQVMYDWWDGDYFEERIAPEAVTDAFLATQDVKAVVEHNPERLLARSNKGKGSLTLTVDEKGLKYRFEAPDTQEGNNALELIKRGDYSGSSFKFRAYSKGCVEKEWSKEKQRWIHTIRKFDGIYDVCITTDPAYVETTVDVRSLQAPEGKKSEEEMRSYYAELEQRARRF